MKLVVGLGNPGLQYESTRHNIGFKAIDSLCNNLNISLNKSKFNGIFWKDKNLIVAKPLTYMNLSGVFVRDLVNFFKIQINDILIIYDDISLTVGKIKFKIDSSAGGHNGMQNIIDYLETQKIPRIKIGVGSPKSGENLSNYVLSPFDESETQKIQFIIGEVIKMIKKFINNNLIDA